MILRSSRGTGFVRALHSPEKRGDLYASLGGLFTNWSINSQNWLMHQLFLRGPEKPNTGDNPGPFGTQRGLELTVTLERHRKVLYQLMLRTAEVEERLEVRLNALVVLAGPAQTPEEVSLVAEMLQTKSRFWNLGNSNIRNQGRRT